MFNDDNIAKMIIIESFKNQIKKYGRNYVKHIIEKIKNPKQRLRYRDFYIQALKEV